MKYLLLFLGLFAMGGLIAQSHELGEMIKVDSNCSLMGSRFEFTAISTKKSIAKNAIRAGISEVKRIENIISSWEKKSLTSTINRNAGIKPVVVNIELYNLIKRAKKVSQLSDGAFDISYASVDKIWYFDHDMNEIPTKEKIASSVSKINYEDIILYEMDTSVFLANAGMKIGFGAIGKGYAANRAFQVMKELGIKDGIVNAGGDLYAWGKDVNHKKWTIGIADPHKIMKSIATLQLENMAIVTSGNYEKYVIIKGQRYSHIIDPRTGYPVRGLKSVSVICPDAELADALATAIFVMGKEKGLVLINQMENIECIIIDEHSVVHYSQKIKSMLQ